ncbi:hypothetical protein [Vibrio phage vB_VpaP_SJSY21]|nr:hypothetical protein [Vibrio phage vB_VpaP_SJSY21]
MQKLLQLWNNLFKPSAAKVEDIVTDLEVKVQALKESVQREQVIDAELQEQEKELAEKRKVSAERQERGGRIATKIEELIK